MIDSIQLNSAILGPLMIDNPISLPQVTEASTTESSPFFTFFIGLIIIPLSLVCIWKNEKKIVMYHKVIEQAR